LTAFTTLGDEGICLRRATGDKERPPAARDSSVTFPVCGKIGLSEGHLSF
jgi:hypothetical protein